MADAAGVDHLGELTFISYADFGKRFFEIAVTRERVVDAVAGVAGRPIDVGPLAVGPLGLIKIRANGSVGTLSVVERVDEHVAFDVTLPVQLDMVIEIGFDKHRFSALIEVALIAIARAAAPLRIALDVVPPTRRNVAVQLHADGLRASVIQVVAGVDRELKRAVAKFVRGELDKPEIRAARVIDVGKFLATQG